MAIKIISENEPIHVNALITYIYADPGVGKTSLCFTASRPVLFDFDGGAHRTGKLRLGKTIPIQTWSDVSGLEQSDLEGFDTIIIDTAGNMLESIKTHLARTASNKQGDGSLTIKAHGVAGELFRSFLARLRSYGKDIVLVAHATEDKKKDNVIIRPDVGGKNQGLLYRQADLMAYFTNIEGKEGRSLKVLDFVPNTSHHAKNSGGLGTVEVPDLLEVPTFLGDLIQRAKDHVNSLTDAQVKELSDMDDLTNWGNDCDHCTNAQDLNEMVKRLDEDHSRYLAMRKLIAAAAKQLDVTADKETKKYFDNAFIPPTETLAEDVVLSPEADELLTFIINATLEADFIRAEQQIADLAKIERQPLLNAIYNRRVELEGQTQEFDAPLIQSETLMDDSVPNVLITEETLAQDIEAADSVSRIDHVIRQIENHDNQVERTRLLKTANEKRRNLKAYEQEHAA